MAADLGGDDIKVVRYVILFTKPGAEAVLEQGEEAISYATDEASFTGRVLAGYLVKCSPEFPAADKKYLAVTIQVLHQYPPEAELEPETIKALREIRDKL